MGTKSAGAAFSPSAAAAFSASTRALGFRPRRFLGCGSASEAGAAVGVVAASSVGRSWVVSLLSVVGAAGSFGSRLFLGLEVSDFSWLEIHFSRFKRLQYGRHGFWALADRLRSQNDVRLARRYDRFVVLTEEDKGYWPGLDNLRVIPNPIHYNPEMPNDLKAKTVIAIGRYTYQKGIDRLLEVWRLVCDRLPMGHGWTLRLAGDGELYDDLSAQIRRLDISDSVVLGRVEHDMETLYRNASILTMTSRFEGLPMVLLEASAFGIPAVCFDFKCGPKDVITPGKNGLIVPDGDIEGFADALLLLIQDLGKRRQMGQAAFNLAPRWHPDNILRQWTTLFEEICYTAPFSSN